MKKLFTLGMALFGMLIITSGSIYAQDKTSKTKIKVKIVTDQDGETTVIEKELSPEELEEIEKDLQELQGDDVNVDVQVRKLGEGGKEIEMEIDMEEIMREVEQNLEDAQMEIDKAMQEINIEKIVEDVEKSLENIDVQVNVESGNEQVVIIKKSVTKNGESTAHSYRYEIGDDEEEDLPEGVKIEKVITDSDADDGESSVIVITHEDDSESADGTQKSKVVIRQKIKVVNLSQEKQEEVLNTDAKPLELETLKFYPNPSSGQFTLEIETGNKRKTDIRITDIQGKQVYSKQIARGEEPIRLDIDLSGEGAGTYLLEVKQGRKATVKKIIVQ